MNRHVVDDLVRLAWPVLVAQLAVLANGVIDTIMAGRYGTLDLAAVGVGASVYITVFVAFMGVLLGLTPVVAQHAGAGRDAAIGEDVRQGAWLALLLAIPALAVLAFPGPILAISRLDADVEAKARDYLAAVAWSVPAALAFRVFTAFTTAVSMPRIVMALNLAGLALKIPLNALFMHGGLGLPAMGAAGLATATSVIAWLTAIAAWTWVRIAPQYRRFGVFAHASPPRGAALAHLAAVGLPIGFTFLVDVSAFTFMSLFIARLGPLAIAGHQIAANLAALAYMVPLALGNAAAVVVGQALGANRPARARHAGAVSLVLGLAIAIPMAAVLYFGRDTIATLYTNDAAVAVAASSLVAIVSGYHLADALQGVAVNVLRGYKKTVVPMIVYAIALWGVGLAGGYVLGFTQVGVPGLDAVTPLGARGFWIAATASVALVGALMTAYFFWVSKALSGRSRPRGLLG
jgi:MATE family multidrug resistance protein